MRSFLLIFFELETLRSDQSQSITQNLVELSWQFLALDLDCAHEKTAEPYWLKNLKTCKNLAREYILLARFLHVLNHLARFLQDLKRFKCISCEMINFVLYSGLFLVVQKSEQFCDARHMIFIPRPGYKWFLGFLEVMQVMYFKMRSSLFFSEEDHEKMPTQYLGFNFMPTNFLDSKFIENHLISSYDYWNWFQRWFGTMLPRKIVQLIFY